MPRSRARMATFTLRGLLRRIRGNYATIPNYLEMELRYMDAGERGPKAPTLATGDAGLP